MCYVILKSFPKTKETTELWNFELCRTGTSHHHFPHGEGVEDLLFLTATNLKMFSAYLVRRGLPLSLFYGPSLILVKWRTGPGAAATAMAREEGLLGHFINNSTGSRSDWERKCIGTCQLLSRSVLRSLPASSHFS